MKIEISPYPDVIAVAEKDTRGWFLKSWKHSGRREGSSLVTCSMPPVKPAWRGRRFSTPEEVEVFAREALRRSAEG
jgi:hypothetical protein